MNNKSLLLLLTTTVLAIIVGVVTLNCKDAQTSVSQDNWLDIDVANLSQIKINTQGKTLTVNRVLQQWQIAELEDYQADVNKLAEFVKTLKALKVSELKTKQPKHFHLLGLTDIAQPDSEAVLVELISGDTTTTFLLGKTASSSSGQYARLSGDNQSVLLNKSLTTPEQAKDWMATDIWQVKFEQVRGLIVSLADSSAFEVIRPVVSATEVTQSEGMQQQVAAVSGQTKLADEFELANSIEGKQLSYPGILSGLVRNVIGADAEHVAKTLPAGAESIARFTINLEQSGMMEQVTADLHKQQLTEDEAEYWLQLSGSQWVHQISSFDAKQITKPLTEYFQQ